MSNTKSQVRYPSRNTPPRPGHGRRAAKYLSALLMCALSACGGVEGEEPQDLEEESEALTLDQYTFHCLDVHQAEYVSLQSARTDAQTLDAEGWLVNERGAGYRSCYFDDRHMAQSCFDPVLNRHYESHYCVVKRPDGGLRRTTSRGTFLFSPRPMAGADARPIYRCLQDGRDMVTKSPTCGTLNIAPVSELGYSFPATTPGVTQVFRCRRPGPADIFMSRDPACEGHVREASLGFAF